jgi:hypothetical protein
LAPHAACVDSGNPLERAVRDGEMGGGERADAAWIATRLGLSEEVVRRLQRRGVLSRFDLSDAEIRRRLYEANVRGTGASRR